eukprot:gi/632961829/ref/XP_007896976.1/ PREDICTED: rho guanine nucleotide exchange factor 18 isoform X2 [Callorhinchus milii]
MADSPLNNSWPSFPKFWTKRWSFKRDCKPCPRGFSQVPEMPSPTQCGNPETRSHSLSGVEEMYFSHMAEGKDDTFLDGDDSATDVSSSVEDIPFLDSSIQGLSGFSLDPQSQGASSSEDITASRPPDRAGTHTHTYPGALPVTMEADDSWPQRDADGCNDTDPPADERPGSSWDTDNELDAESQDIVPLLIRSMSTSRRYSWEGPLSPSAMGGMRRRLSLDVLGIDSDGEGDQEDEEQDNLSQDQGSFSFPEFRPVTEGEADGDGTTTPPESMEDEQDQEHGAMHLRTETVFTNGSKTAQGRFPRKVACVQVGATDSGIDKDPRAEKENLEPNHLLVQQVLQELKAFHGARAAAACLPEGSPSPTSAHNLTWMEFLAEKEEGNKSERPERGTKVKRTLSSLKNRMTGSFKDKGKSKDREREKESPKEKRKSNSGHELMPGTFSSLTNCTVCSKPLTSRNGYQCVNCAVNVHKNCRTLLTECPGRNKKHPVTSPSSQRPPSAFLRESQRSAHPSSDGNTGAVRSLGMTILPGGASQPALSSTSSVSGLTLAEMEQEVENGVPRSKPWPEDSLGAREPSVESLVVEDMVFAPLKRELEADGQDMEAESWSLAVESAYAKTQSKETTKRQDVIYELMQTEMHHIRTLKIMVGVYSRGLREELQVDVDRIFPCLDDLLKIHSEFFSQLRERRRDSLEDGSDRNYLIRRIGDLLVQQFSGERGERMRDKYGTFCSRHNEATNYYKEQFQSNKKFQSLIKKLSNCPVVRRLGVQECVLLVTQRITKYPVLVERIILNTTAGSEEHTELTLALCRIKETLACVDTMVNEYEKSQRLKEIVRRMEIKSVTKLKNGTIFRRHDMLRGKLRLLHEGVVCWKAASGRLKDILALVLSDVIVLLQEKDQKYSFATVDQKPAGISLYKLIVRKVANEEKGMFLISASDEGPEMYEIHTNSKEERNTWMAIIREAVDRYPLEEVAALSEPEEERRQTEFRAAKSKEFQERLNAKDEQIKTSLNEKLEIYSEMAELNGYQDLGRSRLLLRADALECQQGEPILSAAVKEIETLQTLVASLPEGVSWRAEDSGCSTGLPRRAETFGGYDSSSANPKKNGSIKKKTNIPLSGGELKLREKPGSRASSEPQLQEAWSESETGRTGELSWGYSSSLLPDTELVQSVQTLTHLLYSLWTLVAQQDSYIEVQRSAHTEREKQYRLQSSRGNLLLEQEKQRSFEKQREELAGIHKLQSQVRQEQARWERDRERQLRDFSAQEARLQEREESIQQQKERLGQDRQELDRQRMDYQQDLERLLESQRAVDRERERLDQLQRKLLKQSSLGSTSDPGQLPGLTHSQSLDSDRMEASMPVVSEPPAQPGLKYQGLPGAGFETPEYPPDSQLRRENSTCSQFVRTGEGRSSLALKTEVPIHLISTTNQILKQSGVQQQIPTKLATMKSGKDKSGRGKERPTSTLPTVSIMPASESFRMKETGVYRAGSGEARTSHSSKLFTKDEGGLRARRSSSPLIPSSQSLPVHQESPLPSDSLQEPQQPGPTMLPQGTGSTQTQPPTSAHDDPNSEVIFF